MKVYRLEKGINWKFIREWGLIILLIALVNIFIRIVSGGYIMNYTKEITSSEPFVLDGKEWQCGYTSRQVDINMLEEKIHKLKGE